MLISITYNDGDDNTSNDGDCDDATDNDDNVVYSCLQLQTERTDCCRVRHCDHLNVRSACSLLQISV